MSSEKKGERRGAYCGGHSVTASCCASSVSCNAGGERGGSRLRMRIRMRKARGEPTNCACTHMYLAISTVRFTLANEPHPPFSAGFWKPLAFQQKKYTTSPTSYLDHASHLCPAG